MKAKKNNYKQELVCFFILMYICSNSMLLARSSIVKNILIMGTIAGMLIMVEKYKLRTYSRIILLYIALISTTILGAVTSGNVLGISQTVNVTVHFCVLFVVFFGITPDWKQVHRIMNTYVIIAVLVSIQCLILFIVVWFDLMTPQMVYYEAYGMDKLSYGVLGFGDAINHFGSTAFLRTSGFFREPSKLGAFLIAPIFWTFAQYKLTKKKKYVLFEVLMVLNFLATFSRAAWLAMIVSIVGCIVLKTRKDKLKFHVGNRKKVVATLIGVTCVIILIVSGRLLYKFSQTADELAESQYQYEGNVIEGMISRSSIVTSETGNVLIRDDSSFSYIFSEIAANPFGYGLEWSNGSGEFNNPTGFGFWFYSGGIPALFLIILIYVIFIYKYYLVCMYSGDIKLKVIGSAFLGITIQNMSYGTWEEPYYLLIIGLMVLCVESKIKGNKVSKEFW